jgi:hypothetical protein
MSAQNVTTILAIIAAAFVIKADLGGIVAVIFRREQTAEEIASHERAEGALKTTIDALETRIGVLETSQADVLTKYGLLTARYEQLLQRSGMAGDRIERWRRLIRALLDRQAQLEALLMSTGVVHDLAPIAVDPADLAELQEQKGATP